MNSISRALFVILLLLSITVASPSQTDKKKDEKKKTEPYRIERLTQGMGLFSIGKLSPDRRSVLLVASRPEQSPNLYIMDLADFSIRPPLTSFRWGVADPEWSPDGQSVALAGFTETANFSDLYLLDLKTKGLRRLTSNSFSDKQPVFSPDGKRLFYTTDESPLPDAAFGILHIASMAVAGGKPEYFTEDETSSILPGIAADGKSVLLVKVDDASGRHSLWQYGMDGKSQRDLTERRFARIHRYIPMAGGAEIILWAQEEPEQQDGVYLLDTGNGSTRGIADADLPKRSPAVSPNGQLIAFIAPTEAGAHLFMFDKATGQAQQLTVKGGAAFSPVFISDTQVLFGSDRDKERELYLVNLSTPAKEEKKEKK